MKSVIVVGAGFSGLVAAWRLSKDGYQVTVVEKSNVPGGLIKTEAHALGLVETAANGLLSSKIVEELFSDCGIEIQIPKKSAKRRYLAVSGRLVRFPLTFSETFATLIKLASFKKNPPQAKESLAAWAERALGQPVADKVVATGVLGIYAAESSRLSASLIVGRFFDRDKTRSSRGRIKGTVSTSGGMGEVLLKIRKELELRGVVFRFNTSGDQAVANARAGGSPVVLATSAWAAAEVLKEDPRQPALRSVESIPLISVTAFFKSPPPKVGFGTLFSQTSPYGESDGILGALQNSEIFNGRVDANREIHSETWILGGAARGEIMIQKTDDEIIDAVLAKRAKFVDPRSRERFVGVKVTRWPRAIPLYNTELERNLVTLNQDGNGVVLFGNYLGSLGLAAILESTLTLEKRVENL